MVAKDQRDDASPNNSSTSSTRGRRLFPFVLFILTGVFSFCFVQNARLEARFNASSSTQELLSRRNVEAGLAIVFDYLNQSTVGQEEVGSSEKQQDDETVAAPAAPVVVPLATNRSIFFVHVGKTGGETLKGQLRFICHTRRSRARLQSCLADWDKRNATRESAISKHAMAYLHCNLQHPVNRQLGDNFTSFLFSVRSPVDRILSWYKYVHPDGCIDTKKNDGVPCQYKRRMNEDAVVKDFFTCFPKTQDFVDSLGNRNTSSSTNSAAASKDVQHCHTVAMDVVQGKKGTEIMGHTFFNYEYYRSRTMKRFQDKEIFVIRTEHFWDDFSTLDLSLGGPGSGYEGVQAFRHDSKGVRKLDNMTITTQGTTHLCCAILSEISLYMEILEHAANLDNQAKSSSKLALLKQCGGQASLDDLRQHCQ